MQDSDMLVYNFWESYKTSIVPPKCSEIQLVETRRAFYAGFASAHSLLIAALGAIQLDEEQLQQILDQIELELNQFKLLVGMRVM